MAKPIPPASTLRYDISTLKPEERVLDAFPELRNYPAFETHGEGENDWLLRFIIWYCDMGSEYRDMPLGDKKRECFKRAGTPAAEARRASVARWQDAGAVAMAREYVRLQGSLKWGLVFHGIESAWQTIEQLSVPIEGAKDRFGEDDEAKTQTAYKTRRDNLTAMFDQVPTLEKWRDELFMGDVEFATAALYAQQQNTPTAERRAEGRSFIPKLPKA